MRIEEWAGLEVRIVGGTDRGGGGDGPVVVLLHGFGAPGTDLVPLHRVFDLPEGVRWVFPAAPIDLAAELGPGMAMPGSRAWWQIDMAALDRALRLRTFREFRDQTPDELPAARAKVLGLLEAIDRELGPPPGQLVLGGFSQGAMLTLDVALESERAFGGLLLLSGSILSEARWRARMPTRAGLPVLQTHGTHDPILPFTVAEDLHGALVGAGLEAELIRFRGQHEIPPIALRGVQGFLARLFGER